MDEAAATALQTRMAELCGHLNVIHSRLVEAVVEALEGGLWEQWGIRSPEQWLAWQTGLSSGRARQMVAMARRAAELPVTFAAFADGELSVDQVAVVAKHAPTHNDAEACELARSASVRQLRSALSKYVRKPAPACQPEPGVDGADARDEVTRFFDDDARFIMKVNASTDQGALINSAIDEARDALFLAGHAKVNWVDALVEVCSRSLGAIESPSRRDRFRIYVHLDADDVDGSQAWLNGGAGVPAAVRDALCCDGVLQPLWHQNGLPINVGRARHIVPDHTRRAVLDRDRCCRHPSCGATKHLEVHHILEWSRGGRTDTESLAALCTNHHDRFHRGEFAIVGNADIPGDLRFYDKRGRLIPGTATPHPPNGPPPAPPPGKQYHHPTGERLDGQWLHFTDPAA